MAKMIMLKRYRAKKELIERYKTTAVQTLKHDWWAPQLNKKGEHIIVSKVPEPKHEYDTWDSVRLSHVLGVRKKVVKSYTMPGLKDFVGERFLVDLKLYEQYSELH